MPNQQDYQREHPDEFALPADLNDYDSGTPLRSWTARGEHERADRAEAALATVTAERDELRAVARGLQEARDLHFRDAEQAVAERDAALALVAECCSVLDEHVRQFDAHRNGGGIPLARQYVMAMRWKALLARAAEALHD